MPLECHAAGFPFRVFSVFRGFSYPPMFVALATRHWI
jgi:hypothetical protein